MLIVWDDNAVKQTVNHSPGSFLKIIEDKRKAEITIGNGPYYGMIELISIDEKTTTIKTYAWGYFGKRIIEWRTLLENAP